MREKGIVRRIAGDRAFVEVRRGLPGCCVISPEFTQNGHMQIETPAVPGLQLEDEVTIESNESPWQKAWALVIVPVLLLCGGTVLTSILLADEENAGMVNGWALGAGLAAAAIWRAAVGLLARGDKSRPSPSPRIVKRRPRASVDKGART